MQFNAEMNGLMLGAAAPIVHSFVQHIQNRLQTIEKAFNIYGKMNKQKKNHVIKQLDSHVNIFSSKRSEQKLVCINPITLSYKICHLFQLKYDQQ